MEVDKKSPSARQDDDRMKAKQTVSEYHSLCDKKCAICSKKVHHDYLSSEGIIHFKFCSPTCRNTTLIGSQGELKEDIQNLESELHKLTAPSKLPSVKHVDCSCGQSWFSQFNPFKKDPEKSSPKTGMYSSASELTLRSWLIEIVL